MIYRIIRIALPILIITAMACLPQFLGAEEGSDFAKSSNRLIHREVFDDPPEALSARDRLGARSPAAVLVQGPYVSIQVNVDEFGQNIVGDAANEPSIAVNSKFPNNIVIGWRQFDSVTSNFRQAGWAFSLNGGQSWTFPGVLTPGIFRSDPVLDSNANGVIYYQSLQEDFAVDVFRSINGGMTWEEPVMAFGGDKNWMAVDKSGGLGDGHVYGIWQRFFGCCGQDTFTRSTDRGQSFELPVEVAFRPTFGTMAVGPNGEVYAAGIDGSFFQDFNQFVIAKSNHAKNPSISPTFVGRQVNMGGSMIIGGGPNPDGLLGQANVAVDSSNRSTRGNVYMLASVDPPGADPMDVHLIRSTDGGATWDLPIRVNDDARDNGAWQWFGTHSVAPNGRIDVVWNDTRNSGQTNIAELFYAYSYDMGTTWLGNIPVSPPFDSFVGFPNQNKIGDYYTINSDEVGASIAYAATFNGEQDVYYLRVFPDCNQNGISDVIDINDQTSDDINENLVPDECELVLSEPNPGQVGQQNTLNVSVGTPGETVYFVASLSSGSAYISVCNDSFDLKNPILIGSEVIDTNGEAALERFIPGKFSGKTALFQALELSTCTFSNLVPFTFP